MYGGLQFGVIVLTTSAGIMDHEEARRKKVGGKVSTYAHPVEWAQRMLSQHLPTREHEIPVKGSGMEVLMYAFA